MEEKHSGEKIPDSLAEGLALDKLGKMGANICVGKNGVEIMLGVGEESIKGSWPTAVAALEWILAKQRKQQRR